MFGTILIAVATSMHLYVLWRAASVPFVKRRVPGRVLFAAGAVLWALLVLGRLYGHAGEGAVPAAVEAIGMNWLGTLFLLFVTLLAADLLTGFGSLFPRRAPSVRGLALVAGGALAAIALVQGARPPAVEDFEVRLPALPETLDGTVIVAMSDLHLGPARDGRWLAGRVAQVAALHPDLVVLLGDLVEGHGSSPRGFVPLLGALSAPLGVFAVPGNHEAHGGAGRDLLRDGETGIRVLRNEWTQVRPGLVLAGVEASAGGRRSGAEDGSIEKALAGRPPGACILLNHVPWPADRAAGSGVGLMLSGHTHGGQIWPFGYVTRIFQPLRDGEYDVDGMKIIVCRGTGTWGPRMRLWHRSQILRVTLRRPLAPGAAKDVREPAGSRCSPAGPGSALVRTPPSIDGRRPL